MFFGKVFSIQCFQKGSGLVGRVQDLGSKGCEFKTNLYIGVGSFSILGGQTQRDQHQYLGVGIAKSTYTHACTCTCMHTHVLNIHTPMHACTSMYACMHSLCKHTFYILIWKSLRSKQAISMKKQQQRDIQVNEESFGYLFCLKAIWICIDLYTCIIKIKAMDLHL